MDNLYNWNDTTKIGVALTAFGGFFSFLGFMMFLDSAMLTLGNLLFVAGIVLVMGKDRCKTFFFEKRRLRASFCFFLGILMVVFGYCFLGLLVQGFGFLNLFGNFFPTVVQVLETLPVIGTILQHPFIANILERLFALSHRNV